MKRDDLDTAEVLAILRRNPPGALKSPLNEVCTALDAPRKVVVAKLLKLTTEGLIDYGVTIDRPWLTEKGEELLRTSDAGADLPLSSVEVLNGTALVGDVVAVCVREGNLVGQRVGPIVEFERRKQRFLPGSTVRVKIRVELSTNGSISTGTVIGSEVLDRIVIVRRG